MRLLLLATLLLGLTGCDAVLAHVPSHHGKLLVVGAENFYADIARQIGGDQVRSIAILNNPSLDPHEYEPTSQDAIDVAEADLVIVNGLGYDSWMNHLIAGSPSHRRSVIVAGQVAGISSAANPHIWYDIPAMRRVSEVMAGRLARLDPAHRGVFASRKARFLASLRRIDRTIARIRATHAGIKVAETEPVFGYMLQALGMQVPNVGFQRAIAQGSDPAPRDVIDFQSLLRRHAVRALIYNKQAVEPITANAASIARQEHIPVVGVTESEPAGKTYQRWLLDELSDVNRAITRGE